MKNINMFCLSLEPNHYNFIKKLGYIPVGLGNKSFDQNWFTDKSGQNISKKNKFYSEYTFHYWLWKNHLDKLDSKWIGFCQYKKFWSLESYKNETINIESIPNQVLKDLPKEYENFESVLVDPVYVNNWKTMKFIKMGFKLFLKKPYLIFNKKKRNINFHFDLMHGENNLMSAADLLDDLNKNAFKKFVNSEVSFNPHIMVICKSKEKLKSFYKIVFPWLEKCEKLFGFENLSGYNQTRIYGFLGERFMSYWFQKNTKYITMPVIIRDIRKDIR
jgi:hypothetical protein